MESSERGGGPFGSAHVSLRTLSGADLIARRAGRPSHRASVSVRDTSADVSGGSEAFGGVSQTSSPSTQARESRLRS